MNKETEKKIRDIVAGILNIDSDFDGDAEFIKLGADSLFFAKLQIELKKELGKRSSLKDIFSNATVSKLTDKIVGEVA